MERRLTQEKSHFDLQKAKSEKLLAREREERQAQSLERKTILELMSALMKNISDK